jgi:hypothetical protein
LINTLGKDAKKLLISLIVLISLSPGCKSGVSGGPFPVLQNPIAPLAVSDPHNAWKVYNGEAYALGKKDFNELRNFIIRQDEVIDLYECQIIAINGGICIND